MKNILSQIPQSVIERYFIQENKNGVTLYSDAKNCSGFILLPKKDNQTIEVDEDLNCVTLKIVDKFIISMWKEVTHTHLIIK